MIRGEASVGALRVKPQSLRIVSTNLRIIFQFTGINCLKSALSRTLTPQKGCRLVLAHLKHTQAVDKHRSDANRGDVAQAEHDDARTKKSAAGRVGTEFTPDHRAVENPADKQ